MTTDIIATIETMPAEQRTGALIILDALTRPLTPREIDAALISKCGLSRSRAYLLTNAIKRLHIVAMIGGERG